MKMLIGAFNHEKALIVIMKIGCCRVPADGSFAVVE